MNVVIQKLQGKWVALIASRSVWFRAPTREILIADVEHMESQDWGYL